MSTDVSENNDKLARLLGKPKSRLTFTVYYGNGDEADEIELTIEALSMKEYDKLLSKYPPTPDDEAKGLTYELEKFAPALIAACMVDPEMSLPEARKLWDGSGWSRGDVEGVFSKVLQINHRDSTIPFNGRG